MLNTKHSFGKKSLTENTDVKLPTTDTTRHFNINRRYERTSNKTP